MSAAAETRRPRKRTRALDDTLLQSVRRELVKAGDAGTTSREIATKLGVLDDPKQRRAVAIYLCQMPDAAKIGQRRGGFVWAVGGNMTEEQAMRGVDYGKVPAGW